MSKRIDFAQQALTFLLCFLAFGMANLNLMMSIGTILLLIVWLYHPGPRNLSSRLRENIPALLLIGLFLLHIVWLINTTDFAYALKDIRIKLPLVIFGLVIGTSKVSEQQMKWIFASLGAGIFVAAGMTYLNYFEAEGPVADPRSLVTGISHIRLSVLMVLFVAASLHYWKDSSRIIQVLIALSILNILLFFNLIQSATGFVMLVLLILFTALRAVSMKSSVKWKLGLGALTLVSLIGTGYATRVYYQEKFTSNEDLTALAKTTALGNNYYHLPHAGFVENGNYIFINICRPEMQAAWEQRSKVPFDPDLEGTLTRYLASKGLTKDYEGVDALTGDDIENIETGIPSVVDAGKSGLSLRFHTFVYSIHHYRVSGNASGLSFLQRVVYWNAAFYLIGKYPFLGTGTGDVKREFIQAYEELETNLEPQFRNRAHNQFLTFFVSFGILGFMFFMAMLGYPALYAKPDYLFSAFLLILFASCLTEDTLETQAGVTIFAYFYALLPAREKAGTKKMRT